MCHSRETCPRENGERESIPSVSGFLLEFILAKAGAGKTFSLSFVSQMLMDVSFCLKGIMPNVSVQSGTIGEVAEGVKFNAKEFQTPPIIPPVYGVETGGVKIDEGIIGRYFR